VLFGYGANANALYRQAAEYVEAIIRGTEPAGLPVQQRTVFDLAVNLKIAKTMGLSIPPSLLASAAMVVE
jgi:putative ABC transport system substrate-binding protein